PDGETMAAAVEAMAAVEPDLTVVNLSDVDRNGHARGPDSPEYLAAVSGADAAIGALADDLRTRGRWARSVLVVTADHGMSRVEHVVSLGPALRDAGVHGVTLVADGGVEHVYVEDLAGTRVERVVALALRSPCVEETLARVDGTRL